MSGSKFKGLKDKLFGSLDEQKKDILILWVAKSFGKRFSSLRCLESQIGTKEIFGFLHKEIFGFWADTITDMQDVMKRSEEIKIILYEKAYILAEFEESQKPKVKTKTQSRPQEKVYPEMPYNLQLTNKDAGIVSVTVHAWRQFCDRFCRKHKTLNQNRVAELLKESFSRARQVRLKRGKDIQRLIANKGVLVDYFFDHRIDCRFVVRLEESIILTVEHPF